MRKFLLAVSALMLSMPAAWAKSEFLFLSPDEAAARVATAMNSNLTPQNTNHDVFEILDMKATNNFETHVTSADYVTVIGGEAAVTIGGTVSDNKEVKPGEWQGTQATGGTSYPLKVGSIIIIPPGTSHRYSIPLGGHLLFTIVKHPEAQNEAVSDN